MELPGSTRDNTQAELIVDSCCAAFCLLATIPAFYNIFTYQQNYRTFAMSLFYLTGISALLIRAAYFISEMFITKPTVSLALLIAPGYLTCSTAASQLLMYVLLIIKMNYHINIFN